MKSRYLTHEQTPTRVPPKDHYNPGRTWGGIDPKLLSREVTSLNNAMDQWTFNYADKDPDPIEARMTAKDKQAIIHYLGDWCQYNDWDKLVASFSPFPYPNGFHLLISASVLKNIFESGVRNPFFYIDLGDDWDGSGSGLPTAYGAELNNLFQKALKGMSCGLCHSLYAKHPALLRSSRPSVCAWSPSLACINNQTL